MILFQRGATSWGFQIGRFWMYVPYWSFLRVGCRPSFGTDKEK